MTENQKPEFLSFKCTEKNGKLPECKMCPVKKAGYCDEFIDFMLKVVAKAGKTTSNSKDKDDDLNVLMDALVEIEKKLPGKVLHSSFSGWVRGIINHKKQDRKRNYRSQSISLEDIAEKLDSCKILAGSPRKIPKKKIRYASIHDPKKILSQNTPVLLLANGHDVTAIRIVSTCPGMALLVVGHPRPKKQLIDNFMANEGFLLWCHVAESLESIKNRINSLCRGYHDEINFTALRSTDDDSEEYEYEIADNSWQKKIDETYTAMAVRQCLEMFLSNQALGKCASFFISYLDIENRITNQSNDENSSFQSGKIKSKAIYEEMGRILGKSMAAIKRQDIRCREKMRPAMRECVEGEQRS